MNYLKLNLLTAILLLFITSCSVSSDEDLNSADFTANSSASNVVLRINKESFDTYNVNRLKNISEGDTFEIVKGKRNGDFLEITVAYSGGCQSHMFNVVWDGIVYTDPYNINLMLVHNANNDACEAYITETIIINLKELLGDVNYISTSAYSIYNTFNTTNSPNVKI